MVVISLTQSLLFVEFLVPLLAPNHNFPNYNVWPELPNTADSECICGVSPYGCPSLAIRMRSDRRFGL
uniref:50S ribosomal protein L10 n=1 Tax=Arundo donax TaxID=35708 RepID=A0A0A9G176_ARUDO